MLNISQFLSFNVRLTQQLHLALQVNKKETLIEFLYVAYKYECRAKIRNTKLFFS